MEFNSINDIKKYLNNIGFFYSTNGASLTPQLKIGDEIRNIKKIQVYEEKRLNDILINNTVNPLINVDDINIRVLGLRINYDIVNKFKKEEAKLNKLKTLHDKLNKCEFIYIKDRRQYYKIKDKKLGKSGLFIIDKELIPSSKTINSFDNYSTVERAFNFKDTPNKYKEEYELELDKFNSLAISKLLK